MRVPKTHRAATPNSEIPIARPDAERCRAERCALWLDEETGRELYSSNKLITSLTHFNAPVVAGRAGLRLHVGWKNIRFRS
jgi:hypothetical protein